MVHKIFEKLYANLTRESRLQDKMLALLAEESTIIASLKTENLHEVQKKKEKLLSDISVNSEERWTIVEHLGFSISQRNRKSFKLAECIAQCEDETLKLKLQNLCDELKITAQSIKNFNAQNGDLLKTSLGVVSNTISIINARPAVADTNYKRDGKVHTQSNTTGHAINSPISSFSKSA
jgi:flagellar biosynthesis/type III secretory pathway chaperone